MKKIKNFIFGAHVASFIFNIDTHFDILKSYGTSTVPYLNGTGTIKIFFGPILHLDERKAAQYKYEYVSFYIILYVPYVRAR